LRPMGGGARQESRAHAPAETARGRRHGRTRRLHTGPVRTAAKTRLTRAAARLTLMQPEIIMNEDAFNLSIRKFLKMVGVSSQREIEQAVAKARAGGAIKGNEKFPASVTLEVPGVKLSVRLDGKIELELAGEDVLNKPREFDALLEEMRVLLGDGVMTSRGVREQPGTDE